MIKRLAYLFFAACSLLPTLSYAETKFAVIDARRAMLETTAGRAVASSLEAQLKPDIDQFNNLRAALGKLQEKLTKDGDVLGADERGKIVKELREKQDDYEHLGQKIQARQSDAFQEMAQKMAPRLEGIVKSIVDAEKYDLVLERQTVLYFSPVHDITRRVTEKLNETKKP